MRPIFTNSSNNSVDNSDKNDSANTDLHKDTDHAVRTSQTVWDSSLVLAKFFEHHQTQSSTTSDPFHVNQRKILELGTGQGIVGIAACILGANVTLTDAPQTIPSLMRTVQINSLLQQDHVFDLPTPIGTITQITPLDWLNPQDHLRNLTGTPFDMIIASDVIWLPYLIHPFISLVSNLLASTTYTTPSCSLVMAYQSRSTRLDHTFFTGLEQEGLTVQTVDRDLHDPVYQSHKIDILVIKRRYPTSQ